MRQIILDIHLPHKELSAWFTDPKSIVDLKIKDLTKEIINTCSNTDFILYHNKVKSVVDKFMNNNSWIPDELYNITKSVMLNAVVMYTTSLYWELLRPISNFIAVNNGVFNSATLISMDSQIMVVQLN